MNRSNSGEGDQCLMVQSCEDKKCQPGKEGLVLARRTRQTKQTATSYFRRHSALLFFPAASASTKYSSIYTVPTDVVPGYHYFCSVISTSLECLYPI